MPSLCPLLPPGLLIESVALKLPLGNPANPTQKRLDPLFRVENQILLGVAPGQGGREEEEENQCLEGGKYCTTVQKNSLREKEMAVRAFPVHGGYLMQW